MECKFLGMTAFLCVLFLHSCDAGRTPASSTDVQADDLVEDTVWADTLDAEEELLSLTGETHLDENFMDFLFSFARSRRLQRERICFPLPRIGAAGDTVMLSQTEWNPDFSWMEQDYYTILYNSVEQIEEVKDSTPSQVQVEIYDLPSLAFTSYDFDRRHGRWSLVEQKDQFIQQSELSDFLVFYRHFSTDSLFQMSSIEQPLHFSYLDPEDEMTVVDGTIDVNQWPTFCPEVPSGTLTNVRSGQTYHNPKRMVLQKCGQGNGLMEVFTFEKNGQRWMLTSYDS